MSVADEVKRNLRECRIVLVQVAGRWQRVEQVRKSVVEGGFDVAKTLAGWVPLTELTKVAYFDNAREAYSVLTKGA